NLAALSGMIALGFALFAFMRLPGRATISRRLMVAAVAGVLMPALIVATFMPATSLRPALVVFAIGAAPPVAVLVSLTSLGYRASPLMRATVGLAAWSGSLALFIVLLERIAEAEVGLMGLLAALLEQSVTFHVVAIFIRNTGEIAWLGASI